MVGEGREPKKDNDLFYTCSLIDYISRKTKNVRSYVVNKLGKERLEKIYDLADVYHCDNIERVCDDFIDEANIEQGSFDNVADKRLIKRVAEYEKIDIISALEKVYNSFISPKIDDYNSSVYYENPEYIFECYRENQML